MKRRIIFFVMLLATITIRAQYKLDTLHYAGNSKYFIDIVYLGDGFTADELDSFVDFVKSQNDKFFDKTPWREYKELFNVFYVKTASNESGAGMTPAEPIDNFYGVCFGTSGVDRMPWPTKWNKVYEVLSAVKPDYDMVPIVVNSTKNGGGGGGLFVCFSMETSSIETLRHESGHALGGLADEYWYQGREAANMTQKINPVKWQRWMGENGVDTYRYSEKQNEEAYSWYRPHQNCLMRYLNREYCPVCCEALIEKIHEHSKNVMAYLPKERTVNLDCEEMTFSLNLLKPEPNTLRIDWLLDGQKVSHNQEQLLLRRENIPKGEHELLAIIEDTTLLVRTLDHTTVHATTVMWDVIVKSGDVNADGTVSAADIMEIVNYNMGSPSDKFHFNDADLNNDGMVNIADIIAILNVILSADNSIKARSISTNDFRVGPLPFESVLTFSNKWPQEVETRLELFNAAGLLMMSDTFQDDANCRLNTAQLPPGEYLLYVYQRNKIIYKQKIEKR